MYKAYYNLQEGLAIPVILWNGQTHTNNKKKLKRYISILKDSNPYVEYEIVKVIEVIEAETMQ